MPLILAGAGSIQEGAPPVQTALPILAVVALDGAVVGAIHGAVLVRGILARPRSTPGVRVV